VGNLNPKCLIRNNVEARIWLRGWGEFIYTMHVHWNTYTYYIYVG